MIKNQKHNLGYGYPPVQILNPKEFQHAFEHSTNREMENAQNRLFNYGNITGDPEVKSTLCDWYSKKINAKVDPNNLMITNGSGNGIVITGVGLLKPGDNILFECPTYFLAATLYRDIGVNLIPAVRKEDGTFDYKDLEEKVVKYNIKAFYLVVPFHNPTGANLKVKDRNIIYEMAHKHKFYVFSDDIYELLYYKEEGRQTPMFYCNEKTAKGEKDHLKDFDNNSSPYIISINSFNKAVAPSLKFGFIQAHSDVINKLTFSGSFYVSMGVKSITEHVVRSYIELGYLDKSVKKHQDYIKTNLDIALPILNQCKNFRFIAPEGGYFLFVWLNDNVDVDKVHQKREEYELNFIDGYSTIPENLRSEFPEYKRTLRISVSFLEKDTIGPAVEQFVKLINDCSQ